MAGLPLQRASLPFPPIQGFSVPNHPDFRASFSAQGASDLHINRPFMDTDMDMADAVDGSRAALSNPDSPEDASNEDDDKGPVKDTKAKTKMAAIPEYFALRKTKDGKVPKKRGPKPDSKPARDRRQELNRQAQRNHRQRKEHNQKMLEEALAEATEKTRTALKRTRAAEELQQRMRLGHEHLLRENERLKQLLDVNKIPFEHVIPQQDIQSVDPSQARHGTQQRGDLILRSIASQGATVNKCVTAPIIRGGASLNSATSSLTLFPKSSPGEVSLSGTSLESGSSPISSTDDANRATSGGSGSQSQAFSAVPMGHQPVLHIGSTADALTGQPSGPLLGQSSDASSIPNGPVRHDLPTAPTMPSYHEASNAPFAPLSTSSSVDANGDFMNTHNDTPFTRIHSENPFAIPDHDQAGAEFILALEANCHDHKTLMNARTFNDPVQLGGHSLMLTKVPMNFAKQWRMGDAPHPHELPDVGEGAGKYSRILSLVNLKPLSTTKNCTVQSGEISAAQALGMIRKDVRYAMLDSRDFTLLTNELKDRCRCYGFGAVVEVYEVKDVLDEVFAKKGYCVDDGYDQDNPFWSRVPLSNPHTLNGPEFPALDGLMDFDIAALMRDRHSEREIFLAADLSTFNNLSNSCVGNSAGNPLIANSQSSVASQEIHTRGFPSMSEVKLEPPATISQSPHGQVTAEGMDHFDPLRPYHFA